MGASSSTEQSVSAEQTEVESLAASTGALPLLQKCFSRLADPQTNTVSTESLKECFNLSCKDVSSEVPGMSDSFVKVLDQVGSLAVDIFFLPEKGGLSWVEFVRGYISCCGRMPASVSLNVLLRVFSLALKKAGLPTGLAFESVDGDCKVTGFFIPTDVLLLLWLCWAMSWSASQYPIKTANLQLPDVKHLVLSAVVSCAEDGAGIDVYDCEISSLGIQLPAGKFLAWILTTVPSLTDCFIQFIHAGLKGADTAEADKGPSGLAEADTSCQGSDVFLLTRGRAWSISLASKSTITEEILKLTFDKTGIAAGGNLLYRSSLHGRGLNRLWSSIDGYHGPVLVLIAGNSEDAHDGNAKTRKWVIGVLTQQGFENKDTFYGSSGNLYALHPMFQPIPPSGKEKNCVYSHLHPATRAYEPHPKPAGIAFGGTTGNERIFIDEDFSRITLRHHAVDKTYRSGSLIPNQGFLPVEASILELEAWGLGGRKAKQVQSAHQTREQLFTEQRRKVDLKTFGNWEDSPEKMMMDMVADPNRVKREDR